MPNILTNWAAKLGVGDVDDQMLAARLPQPKWNKHLCCRRAYYVHHASREHTEQLVLNRTSITLPKLLIESMAWEQEGVLTKATVHKRLPGVVSKISLMNKVPGSILYAVAQELGEKIIIQKPFVGRASA